MIEVVLSWSVREVENDVVGKEITAVTDFQLSVDAREAGIEALRSSLLLQLSVYFADTVFMDVVRVAEMRQDASPRGSL